MRRIEEWAIWVCVGVGEWGGDEKKVGGHLRVPSGMCSWGASQVFGRLRFGFRLATKTHEEKRKIVSFVYVLDGWVSGNKLTKKINQN